MTQTKGSKCMPIIDEDGANRSHGPLGLDLNPI